MEYKIVIAFLLSVIAGLCTGIGGIISFFASQKNKKFLSVSLGFSAGVMIYVSMMEIMKKAENSLQTEMGIAGGKLTAIIAFFVGMLLIALIDRLFPEETFSHISDKEQKWKRMGIFTALAIAIHNFPEGLATFISAIENPALAIPIVAAIAIHNIPEGIAVAVPVYQATGSRKKAFFYSFLSGLAEPLGACIGWLLFIPIMNNVIFGIIFAGVSGIMIFISFDELLPASREYGEHRFSMYGLVSGMVVMAVSLLLLS